MIQFHNIPEQLTSLPQWVLWRYIMRDKVTKVPFSFDGTPAKANDPMTWSKFSLVRDTYECGGYDGVGFEFSKNDSFCGIDLDGCRDNTGAVSEWAKKLIMELYTYREI